jgi:hypothetical protein
LYSSNQASRDFQVFCVDNATYVHAAAKEDLDAVKSSGIVNLRRFCYEAAAESKLRAVKHYITSHLPELLSSMKLQISQNRPKTSRKSHTTIKFRSTVDTVCTKVQQHEAKSSLERTKLVQGRLADKAVSIHTKWTDHSMEKARGWSTWHWSTYKAACLHEGCHYTNSQGHFNWNANLVSEMNQDLETPWNEMIGTAVDSCDNCLVVNELQRSHNWL